LSIFEFAKVLIFREFHPGSREISFILIFLQNSLNLTEFISIEANR